MDTKTAPRAQTQTQSKFNIIDKYEVPDASNSVYGTQVLIYEYNGNHSIKVRRYNVKNDKTYTDDKVNLKNPSAIKEVANLLIKLADDLEVLQKSNKNPVPSK